MLTWEYPPHLVGGLSRHVHALSKELARQGHEVHVLTRSAPGQLPDTYEDGVHIIRVPPYFQDPQDFRLWVCHLNFALLEAGVTLLREVEGPAILHAHDWLVAHAARGLKSLFHVPLVTTIHATEHGRHRGIHDAGQQYINDVEWWLTYEAWRVIVCSGAMRSEVQGLFGLSDDKVAEIPNGVELKEAPAGWEAIRRDTYASPSERLIYHLGRLVPEKGAGVLLEAMPHLLRRHPAKLVIGGVGPYGDELKRRAHELGIGQHVYFAGWLPEATAYALYRFADVTVVPSTYEPFGIVALEALAAGTPLVVSDVGGLGEIVQHEVNGLKAYPGHVHSLAEQVDRLLTNRSLARRLAAEGQRQAREKYSWTQVALATDRVYDDVAEAWSQTEWGAFGSPLRVPQTPPGTLPDRYTI
ncbi:MAG TPA: glycosyltransferase family 4 protein [Symbiobacteriaceae bacterium]|jgi:glycosyltransferase involved in cell wall biosynthesis